MFATDCVRFFDEYVIARLDAMKSREEYEGFLERAVNNVIIENDCYDIWEWSEKVYEYAKNIDS